MRKIGEIAYMVSWVEWVLIAGGHEFQRFIPSPPELYRLTGETSGFIARETRKLSSGITHSDVRRFYEIGAANLGAMSVIRNDVLHARPANLSLSWPYLDRWRQGHPDRIDITDDKLEEMLTDTARLCDEVQAAKLKVSEPAIPYMPRNADPEDVRLFPAFEYDIAMFGPAGAPPIVTI